MLTPFVAKPPWRLWQRGRDVPDLEDQRRHGLGRALASEFRVYGQDDEARGVGLFVLDILHQDVEPVDLGCDMGRDRGAADVVRLRDLPGRACGIGRDLGLQPELADDFPALSERMDVALHRLQGRQYRALDRHQMEADRQSARR